MPDNVATLGIAVNSAPVKQATTDLSQFAGMASKAEAASSSFASASNKVTQQLAPLSKVTQTVKQDVDRVALAHGGMSTQAMAAQHSIRSMIESMIAGQPVSQALALQMNHLSYAASGPGGITAAFGGALSSLKGLISPAGLAGAAVVGTGIAAYSAITHWKTFALQLDDVARQAGIASGALVGLQGAASIKGIDASTFFEGIRKLSDSTFDAKNNMGQLGQLLRANGATIGTTQQNFERIADLVSNARDDQQRIQILREAGLPADRQWIDLMSQGADGIRRQAAEITKLGDNTDPLIRKAKEFDDTWNRVTTNVSNYFKSWGQSAFDQVKRVVDEANSLSLSKGPERAPYRVKIDTTGWGGGANDNKPTVKTSAERIADNTKYTTTIAALGDFATVEQLVTAKQKELNSLWLQSNVSLGAMEKAVLNGVRAQAEMNRVQQQASIGVFDFAAAQKAANDTLKFWQDRGLIKSAEDFANAQTYVNKTIRDTADAAKVAGSNFPQLTQAMNDAGNIYKQIDQVATSSMTPIGEGYLDIELEDAA